MSKNQQQTESIENRPKDGKVESAETNNENDSLDRADGSRDQAHAQESIEIYEVSSDQPRDAQTPFPMPGFKKKTRQTETKDLATGSDSSKDSEAPFPLPGYKKKTIVGATVSPSPPQPPPPLSSSQNHPAAPPLNYEEPDWSDLPKDSYSMEVIKGGMVLENVDLPKKKYITFGRLPICDIQMEHPVNTFYLLKIDFTRMNSNIKYFYCQSTSRYHAIIQFKNTGQVYLYDLDSAHGTKVNKQRIISRNYVELRVGDQIKFGESTRTYVVQGPEPAPAVQESGKKVGTSIPRAYLPKSAIESTGVTWGFGEDAEEDDSESAEQLTGTWQRDETAYYYKDPKKALRNWLENRGFSLEFEYEEEGPVHQRNFTARVRLPDVEDSYGQLYGIGTSTKKREAERMAAVDACEKLDKYGILRSGRDAEAAKKTKTRQEHKARKAVQPRVVTYESLTKQHEELAIRLNEVRRKLSRLTVTASKSADTAGELDLDSYMAQIDEDINDESKAKLEAELDDLLKQERHLLRLIEVAKPMDFFKNT
ncbi:5347_t:CDS:10 [Paraglomus occultum]|uniref:5347_t:CDS:1 n=1 Tax=Paraglomus occultum TaxID=144539 RepID=A0A9N9BKT5_9GLOM|nr:5347_t:CDS:10 [Paraglomus occultum]